MFVRIVHGKNQDDMGIEARLVRLHVEGQPVHSLRQSGVLTHKVSNPAVRAGDTLAESSPLLAGDMKIQSDRDACGGAAARCVENVSRDGAHKLKGPPVWPNAAV